MDEAALPNSKIFNGCSCQIGFVKTSIVVEQKNAMLLPSGPFLCNCLVQPMQLLNIEFCVECLIFLENFPVNYAFPQSMIF